MVSVELDRFEVGWLLSRQKQKVREIQKALRESEFPDGVAAEMLRGGLEVEKNICAALEKSLA